MKKPVCQNVWPAINKANALTHSEWYWEIYFTEFREVNYSWNKVRSTGQSEVDVT